jgi:thioredoxin-like negative regulator of GroEL
MWREWLTSARSDEENDEESLESRQNRARRRRRWLWVGASGLLLLSVAGFAAYRFGGQWLERRTRENVGGYLEQQDYRRAQLTLEQAVQVSPHNLAARRALAEFYDVAGSPLAVERWREVVALAGDNDEVKFKLAGAALRLEGAESAQTVLAQISLPGRQSLEYHRISAGIALLEKNAEALQGHLAKMAVLAPDDLRTKISLASIQLRSADPAVAQAAQADLERVARGETFRIRATLALLQGSSRAADGKSTVGLATRLLPADAVEATKPSAITALAEHMKAEPHPLVEDAAALADWLVVQGRPRDALTWLATLGPATVNALPVLAARANAATQLRDWNLLRQLISDGAWGVVLRDAIELAFAARLQRERASVANAKTTFADAIDVASSSLPTLKVLNRLTAIWGWAEESERVLTRTVHDFPREQPAWFELLAKAEIAGKSGRYWELARRRAEALPGDPSARSLRTYAAVITNQRDPEADKAALAALEQEDARAEEIAAGVLLRWREKSASDALALLSVRQVETLRRSRKGALVYGALLASAGKDSRGEFSSISLTHLLPEERALLPKGVAPAHP